MEKIASFMGNYHLIPCEVSVVIPSSLLPLSEFLVNRFLFRCDKRDHIFLHIYDSVFVLRHYRMCKYGYQVQVIWHLGRLTLRNFCCHPLAKTHARNSFWKVWKHTNETGHENKLARTILTPSSGVRLIRDFKLYRRIRPWGLLSL
jgi:hypothetical protein